MNYYEKALNIKDDIVRLRRQFHMYPELDYDLNKTSKKIKEFLNKNNIKYIETAKCGVCAIIEGKGKNTVAIRSDMDALPIVEKNDVSYKSKFNGKMHACGHDAHMAILLGTASILNSCKDELRGNIKLLFEPAEETSGGAKKMISEGVLENPHVDAIIGLHVNENIETGKVAIKKGVVNASSNPFIIKIIGKGAHGATPQFSIDPITISANVINTLQTIISREISPVEPSVITIGSIHGGIAENIIPEQVEIRGIIRTMTMKNREYIIKRFKEIVKGIVESMRGECEIKIIESYPNLYNDDTLYNTFKLTASNIVGTNNVVLLDNPSMSVESFAYFSNERPSVFYYLGCKTPNSKIVNPAHSSCFDIDENCLPIGVAIHCELASKILKELAYENNDTRK